MILGKSLLEKIDSWRFFRVNKLAKFFGISKQRVQQFVLKLEGSGFVEKSGESTRRGQLYMKSDTFDIDTISPVFLTWRFNDELSVG